MKDELGTRIKTYYEDIYRLYLPRRSYVIVRIDGKAFHTYTKNADKPFDILLSKAMEYTTKKLCEKTQGCIFGYTQSDEISLLLSDRQNLNTEPFFKNNIQKIVSITASIATGFFNSFMNNENFQNKEIALFDSRCFLIPDKIEVYNYFLWREQDAIKNSISMLAQSLYSHNELHKKNSSEMQEMCFQKGVNWNNLESRFKRGIFIAKEMYKKDENVFRSDWFIQNEEFSNISNREIILNKIP